jgi:hypothetical protein
VGKGCSRERIYENPKRTQLKNDLFKEGMEFLISATVEDMILQ